MYGEVPLASNIDVYKAQYYLGKTNARSYAKKSTTKFEKPLVQASAKCYYRKVAKTILRADNTTPRCSEMCSQEV